MSDQSHLKDLEKSLKYWLQQRDDLHEKLAKVNEAIRQLELAQAILSSHLQKSVLPTSTFTKPTSGPNATIGDAMEAILIEAKKLLTKDEILERLRLKGVGISLRNPRIVLLTAILRDKKQRFVNLEDGRVTLKGRK